MRKQRAPVKPSKDSKIFSHTAKKTKKINLSGNVMRGGTRL